jgi:hypothetical protein
MNSRLPPEDQAEQIRSELHAVMKKHGVSLEKAAELFSQCASMLLTCSELLGLAEAAELKLAGFKTDEHLELYFDIHRGKEDVGFISKGWSDPGYRMGDTLLIPASKLLLLQANSRKISKLCATNGLVVTAHEQRNPIELHLESVIYKEGFNQKVFLQALETLTECVEQVREMFA